MLKVKSTDKLTLTENNPVIYFSNLIKSQQRNDAKSIKLNKTEQQIDLLQYRVPRTKKG